MSCERGLCVCPFISTDHIAISQWCKSWDGIHLLTVRLRLTVYSNDCSNGTQRVTREKEKEVKWLEDGDGSEREEC